ncbi:MAG: hypothetical protein ABIG66_05210 [Candidatus Kerfeldbacteria bacterium]
MPFEWTDIAGLGSSPLAIIQLFFQWGGLIVFFPLLIWMMWTGWVNWLQNKYDMKKKFVLLAIDVPKMHETTMRSVENIISALHGVHFSPTKREAYWLGVIQDKFSLEIVSIDGYIQYFIRCDDYNAELVKGAVYAQYADAEIIEVEDYVQNVPQEYPNKEYDLWGTEFTLANSDAYPIKTYEFFEHSLSGLFADPMAAVLELLSRLQPGEQVWLQFVITPEGHEWREKSKREVNDLIGKPQEYKKDIADYLTNATQKTLETVHDSVFTAPEGGYKEQRQDKDEMDGSFMGLTTGEKIIVEEVQKKAARLHFQTKFRFVYIAPKEIMNSYRVVGSIFGAFKQFNSLDLNSFTAGGRTVTSGPEYFFPKRRSEARKNKLMAGYKYRSNWIGESSYVMSHVEIATLFHFPVQEVKAPLVSKTVSKKAEPPAHLPVGASPFERLRKGHDRIAVQTLPDAQTEQVVTPEPEPVSETIPAPPPPPEPGEPPVTERFAPVEQPVPEQLHSMPGLPPGVKAVEQPTPVREVPIRGEEAVPLAPPSPQTGNQADRPDSTPTSGGTPPPNLPV